MDTILAAPHPSTDCVAVRNWGSYGMEGNALRNPDKTWGGKRKQPSSRMEVAAELTSGQAKHTLSIREASL